MEVRYQLRHSPESPEWDPPKGDGGSLPSDPPRDPNPRQGIGDPVADPQACRVPGLRSASPARALDDLGPVAVAEAAASTRHAVSRSRSTSSASTTRPVTAVRRHDRAVSPAAARRAARRGPPGPAARRRTCDSPSPPAPEVLPAQVPQPLLREPRAPRRLVRPAHCPDVDLAPARVVPRPGCRTPAPPPRRSPRPASGRRPRPRSGAQCRERTRPRPAPARGPARRGRCRAGPARCRRALCVGLAVPQHDDPPTVARSAGGRLAAHASRRLGTPRSISGQSFQSRSSS